MLLRLLPRGPIAAALREGQSYLNDPKKASAYVVTLPETLPVSECLELLEGLKKTAMPTGGVILNRFPVDPFTRNERELLHPLVDSLNLFGSEGFHKPESSRRELARLRAGTQLPIYLIPELPQAGLIARVADALLSSEDIAHPNQERATG